MDGRTTVLPVRQRESSSYVPFGVQSTRSSTCYGPFPVGPNRSVLIAQDLGPRRSRARRRAPRTKSGANVACWRHRRSDTKDRTLSLAATNNLERSVLLHSAG